MPEIGTSGSMSGDRKRSDAARPKLPRLSSTLPNPPCRQPLRLVRNLGSSCQDTPRGIDLTKLKQTGPGQSV